MNVTPELAKALKVAMIFVLVMFVYAFLLSYFEMYGISISHPEENSTLRTILNKGPVVLKTAVFWLLLGYICKDYISAGLALIVAILIPFGIDAFFPYNGIGRPPKDLTHYLLTLTGLIPVLVFGFTHFKNTKAFKLTLFWLITWGLAATYNARHIANVIGRFTNIFEIKIPTGESSYRLLNLLQMHNYEVIVIVRLLIFWWMYELIKNNTPLWSNLTTMNSSSYYDRTTYSIVYWVLRIILFVTGIGLTVYIGNSFREPLHLITVVRVLAGILGIIVLASLYRNFLGMFFIQREKYPDGLYLALNIPIINLFTWIFSLFRLNNKTDYTRSEASDIFDKIKSRFKKEGRNSTWKILLIILNAIVIIYQLKRTGLDLNSSSFVMITAAIITFSLTVWFLYNKHAFIPILILSGIAIISATVLRNPSFLSPTVASGLVNVIVFYGFFYFDELKID